MSISLDSLFSARGRFAFGLLLAVTLLPHNGRAQQVASKPKSDSIHEMSDAFETLVRRVSPAVVEVLVTGYGTGEEDEENPSATVGRERSLGSGVIIDPDGYIVTNFHVVKGADRVRVVLTPSVGEESQAVAMLKSKGRILTARVVGVS